MGLNDIMAALHAEGKKADDETAEEILYRLERKNYIPASDSVRREYAYVLLKKYRIYLKGRS